MLNKKKPNISRERKVFAVIVTFNRLSMLKQTLTHSLSESFDGIVVVNNASTDGTQEWLNEQKSSLLNIVHLPVNVGGAGGFHRGFQYVADQTDADWLVCFDDDAYPELNAIARFKALSLDENVAGVAAAVYLPDGRISEMNRPSRDPFGSFAALLRTLIKRRAGFHVADSEYSSSALIDIDFSSFVGCFLRVRAIREHLGLPRKELFIYADDIMYTHGIGKAGLNHLFAPEIKFVHDCATLQQQMDVYKPLWKVYYTYRNRLELFRQIAGPALFYPIAVLKLFSWIAKARYYERPSVFLRLLLIAWWHGVLRRFSLSHADVIRLAAG